MSRMPWAHSAVTSTPSWVVKATTEAWLTLSPPSPSEWTSLVTATTRPWTVTPSAS